MTVSITTAESVEVTTNGRKRVTYRFLFDDGSTVGPLVEYRSLTDDVTSWIALAGVALLESLASHEAEMAGGE